MSNSILDTPASVSDAEGSGNSENASQEMSAGIGSSTFFLALGIYMFICGFRMPSSELTGSPGKWYIAPGVFPAFIGVGLAAMAASLIVKTCLTGRRAGGGFSFSRLRPRGEPGEHGRLITAGLLLTAYAASLGRVNFTAATFLFLFITMLRFRVREFAVWKMALISAVFSAAVTYGFGTLARIPLP